MHEISLSFFGLNESQFGLLLTLSIGGLFAFFCILMHLDTKKNARLRAKRRAIIHPRNDRDSIDRSEANNTSFKA